MFVTTCTKNRNPIFSDDAHARVAIESLYQIQRWFPFFLYAFVIMPDHCHFLLKVPEPGTISRIMYTYKRSVAFAIGKPVWQRRFYVKHVSEPGRIIDYIHVNPVRHNLCKRTDEYQWSSASGKWYVSELTLM